MKSILVINTPSKGCRNCPINALDYCMILNDEVPSIISSSNRFHPNCPLISVDIEELEEALDNLVKYSKHMKPENEDDFAILEDFIIELGGK